MVEQTEIRSYESLCGCVRVECVALCVDMCDHNKKDRALFVYIKNVHILRFNDDLLRQINAVSWRSFPSHQHVMCETCTIGGSCVFLGECSYIMLSQYLILRV